MGNERAELPTLGNARNGESGGLIAQNIPSMKRGRYFFQYSRGCSFGKKKNEWKEFMRGQEKIRDQR
ncbi:hypothetical protein [Desulfonatronospira thiodismutans]|uniref:hypothetical protein n=1 Tax=Desulfonatronospira thiodismutans TaxID=488939 RepID=UPI001ABF3571|nr:hypothetical protein [Desulfonatronospira thiodismutans]